MPSNSPNVLPCQQGVSPDVWPAADKVVGLPRSGNGPSFLESAGSAAVRAAKRGATTRHLPGDPVVVARAQVMQLEQALFAGVGKGCALGLRRRPDGLFQPRDAYSRTLNQSLEGICRELGQARQRVAELEGAPPPARYDRAKNNGATWTQSTRVAFAAALAATVCATVLLARPALSEAAGSHAQSSAYALTSRW